MINSENINPSTLRRMLEEIGNMAENSSLTGNDQGRGRLVKHYNSVLEGLKAHRVEGADMFVPLEESEADFGTIAVESQMLFSATGSSHKDKHKDKRRSEEVDWLCGIAPFLDSSDLELLIQEKLDNKLSIPDDLLPAIAPFVSREFLGKMVRKRFANPPEEKKAETPPSDSSLVFSWDSKPETPKVNPSDEVADIVSRVRSDLTAADRDRLQETLSRVLRELESNQS